MKPRVPITVWSPPPDPVDGLLADVPTTPEPDRAPEAAEQGAAPHSSVKAIAQPEAARRHEQSRAPKAARQAVAPKVHLTVYLDPEELDLLRAEQHRRQRELRGPRRGVTDASAVVADLIRKNLS